MIIPVPKGEIKSSDLEKIFTAHHIVRKDKINIKVPERVLPLVFLSKIPSLANAFEKFDLMVSLLSRPSQHGYHVDSFSNYLEFINDSPFNVATVDSVIKMALLDNKSCVSLHYLDSALRINDKSATCLFVRQYVSEVSSKGKATLIYPATIRFFLRRVFMIREDILNSRAVKSFAKTIGYFIWNEKYQNYSFADGIRNSRTEKEVTEILQKLMREAKLRYDQESKKIDEKTGHIIGERPSIPSIYDLEELNRLMKENFNDVKAALYLMAFSYESYKKIYMGDDCNA